MSIDYSKVICFDMEMCCWDDHRQTGEIISIGLCELNLVSGEVSRDAHYFVKPRTDEVSPFCTGLTGITQRMVDKQGRPLKAVLDTIAKNYGSKRPYVAWGADAEYLANQCSALEITSPLVSTIDLGLIYKIKRRSDRSVSLKAALGHAGLEFQGTAHNALVDAVNLARLIVAANLL